MKYTQKEVDDIIKTKLETFSFKAGEHIIVRGRGGSYLMKHLIKLKPINKRKRGQEGLVICFEDDTKLEAWSDEMLISHRDTINKVLEKRKG